MKKYAVLLFTLVLFPLYGMYQCSDPTGSIERYLREEKEKAEEEKKKNRTKTYWNCTNLDLVHKIEDKEQYCIEHHERLRRCTVCKNIYCPRAAFGDHQGYRWCRCASKQ